MSKGFLVAFAVGLLAVGLILYWIYESRRGLYLVPQGRIRNVRTAPADEGHSVMAIDFQITDPSDREMIVRTIEVTVHKSDGSIQDGLPVAATDVPKMFRFYKHLGPLENPALREREHIAAHQTVFRTTALQFEVPESVLLARRDVQLTIEDVTGPKLELSAK